MTIVRHKRALCIGIITIPLKTQYGNTHIMKTYVDWFENMGVTVIPIPYNTTEHEKYFNMVNGLFIPGEKRGINDFDNNRIIIKCISTFLLLSLREYFPIWGTCFGFQALICLIAGFTKLKDHPAQGVYPVHISNSRLFKNIHSKHLLQTQHNHDYGISVEDFIKNHHLRRFYTISSTSIDNNNKEYITSIEAKYYPIYGTAWHPERHDPNQFICWFFISELKKNTHICAPFTKLTLRTNRCIHEIDGLLCYYF